MGRSCRTRSHLSNVRIKILSLQAKLVDLSQQVRKHYGTNEKTFWLQPSDVHCKPFTPRSWRKTTQAHALLVVPTMDTSIEFFLHLVAMDWILVVFLRIQRKSIKEDACKGLRSNGATRCLQIFGENLRRMAFTNSFNVVTDRIVYSWRRSTVTDGRCKDNTSKDPFSRCEICKNLGYRLSGRHSDKNTIDDTKHNTKPDTVCSDLKHLGNTWACT